MRSRYPTTWRWVARGWTSSASTIGWWCPGPGARAGLSLSSLAGPQTRPCSVPATGSGNSLTGAGCCSVRRRSRRTCPCSCADGPRTSVTGTRLGTSGRSSIMRDRAWRRSSGNAVGVVVAMGGRCWCISRPTNSVWSVLSEPSWHPGRTSPGGRGRMPVVNGVGEPCAGEPHARFEVAGTGNGARNPAMGTGVAQPIGKPSEERPQVLPPGETTAPVPDPTPSIG
jgi:hypothetical protein